jgi:hypothetical protein
MKIFFSLLTLTFINGSYFLISFNIESVFEQSMEEDITEVVSIADHSASFDLTDLLDLDIFDFDVDELENRHQKDEYISKYFSELIL